LIWQDDRDMTQDSKGRKIGYWITTGLAAFAMLAGGVGDVLAPPEVIAILESLGYPAYAAQLIGVGKILGGVIILAPKLPRLKEWAYAGMAIDLIGATWSHAASGHAAMDIITPLIVLAIAMGSWYLRPADRKLPDAK
jgi:uncharacterized membrane protein YphA (DoxX/SURF4 family)